MAFEFEVKDNIGQTVTVVADTMANTVRKANALYGSQWEVASPMRNTRTVSARRVDSALEFAAALWEGTE